MISEKSQRDPNSIKKKSLFSPTPLQGGQNNESGNKSKDFKHIPFKVFNYNDSQNMIDEQPDSNDKRMK